MHCLLIWHPQLNYARIIAGLPTAWLTCMYLEYSNQILCVGMVFVRYRKQMRIVCIVKLYMEGELKYKLIAVQAHLLHTMQLLHLASCQYLSLPPFDIDSDSKPAILSKCVDYTCFFKLLPQAKFLGDVVSLY
jgi:hypothetical protein